MNHVLTTERLVLYPVVSVAVIERLGMTAFEVVPGVLAP
jgi:hypothetical protein